jgi:hypothetical protein
MFKRPFFWLGLLLGSVTAFRSLRWKPRKPVAVSADLLIDLIGDALVTCDSAGTLTYSNAAALTLFGPQAKHLPALYYPNGQLVPPGQMPLTRVRSAGQKLVGAEYHGTDASGAACVLAVSAYPLPGGGAAAVFRDVTAQHTSQAHLSRMQARQTALCTLGRRLGKAATLEDVGRIVVEETYSLLGSLPDVQVRLYGYSSSVQTLTRLASEPEDRPKRPKSSAQSQPPVFPFDASVSVLWQLYIARQPTLIGLSVLGEAEAASVYALPLPADGLAVGHLSVSSSASNAFDDPALRETLELLASTTALSLAGPQSAELAANLKQQRDAIGEIAQAIAAGVERSSFVDLAIGYVKRITKAEVCTVSVAAEGKLVIAGEAFRDDLLFPERNAPNNLTLQSKAAQKAWRTQKPVTRLAVTNPEYQAAVWRAFAEEGCHSVVALPLTPRLGVLTIYMNGVLPLPDTQMKFLETIAALLSIGLASQRLPAIAEESPAGC